MEFTTKQIEHLIECLNFYYSENDDIKLDIVQVNSECANYITGTFARCFLTNFDYH